MAKLNDVNTTDIPDAIRLGCQTMRNVFNADDDDIPFFESLVYPDARLGNVTGLGDSHVPGRHLNALLNAEDAIGVQLDEDTIAKHTRAAFLSYRGPAPLPLSRRRIDGKPVPGEAPTEFNAHHIREGFHALTALVKFRDSDRAREVAESSIRTILDYWDPIRGWDLRRLQVTFGWRMGYPAEHDFSGDGEFISGIARCMGPLVKYFRATGYGPALELAIILKEKCLDGYFPEDGSYLGEKLGHHTHSTTCVMSSMAQLADLTTDSHLMNRAKSFYDNGLWEIRDAIGWVIEGDSADHSPDFGEINNTGDILETALILGRWGYTECYSDAERILRGHLLPSQLRDISFIPEKPNPTGEDGRRDIARRHIGAYGFPAPYGHKALDSGGISFNMDIVGGGVGSLCEAVREATRYERSGHWVCLLFDRETASIRVESPYTGPGLRVRVKRPGPLFVRVPAGVDPAGVRVHGTDEAVRVTNGYLHIGRPAVNRTLTFEFALPETTIVLKHRTRDIRARLRGESVVAMDSFGADFTYFDPIE